MRSADFVLDLLDPLDGESGEITAPNDVRFWVFITFDFFLEGSLHPFLL